MPDMGNIRIKDENMNKTTIITNVQTHLFELQDLKYRDFHAKLMPTVNKEKIIGVRTPALRVFAKKYGKTDEAKEYLNEIKEFLQKKLELELNDKTNIFKAKQGVNFCGYKINEYRLKVRNKGKNKFKKKVKNLLKEIKEGNISSKDARQYLTGHLGYFEIANTYNLKQKNIFLQDELLRKNIIN